jgi:hypothetical protein
MWDDRLSKSNQAYARLRLVTVPALWELVQWQNLVKEFNNFKSLLIVIFCWLCLRFLSIFLIHASGALVSKL